MDEKFSPIEIIRSGRWHSALFGTYVLSLSFFEATLLPTLRQAGVRSIVILADIDGIAGALGEAGAREVGRTYELRPIKVRDGVFHPKFMLLDGSDGPSAVIGSGNLTFGGWGHNLELCEVLRPGHSGTALQDLADFTEELSLTDRVSGVDAGAVEIWTNRLRSIAPSGSARVLHNVTTPIATLLVGQAAELGEAKRLTVASPYYGSASAVEALASALGDPAVEVHVHDGDRLPMNGHHFPFDASGIGDPVVIDFLSPESRGPLHAKLIEIECDLSTLLMTGSVNASVPALSEARNVELAVLRLVDGTLERKPAQVPVPIPVQFTETHEALKFGILQATLLGAALTGSILTKVTPGPWQAEFDHDGVLHDLGEIEVAADGSFEGEITIAGASYGRRRSTLVLRRGDDQVRGFVSFPDAIELNNRWGVAIGPMIRIAGGSDDDDDLAGILEYFASNPMETASAWRGPRTAPAPKVSNGRLISLSELEVREARDDHSHGQGYWADASRGALDRILAALRIRFSGPSIRRRGATDNHEEIEDADVGDEDRGSKRVIAAFEALLEVLEERIPLDPVVELLRAGEIAGFVLLRNPEPLRIGEFALWWTNQAMAHLETDQLEEAISTMAAGMLMLDGMADGGAGRVRGRIARVFSDVEKGIELALSIEAGSRLRRLMEVVGGADALEAFAEQVRLASSAVEEVIVAASYVARGLSPPPLPLLDNTDEMRTVRRLIENDQIAKIIPATRGDEACPRCHRGLPDAERLRLRSIGMARAANCCNRVLLVGIE